MNSETDSLVPIKSGGTDYSELDGQKAKIAGIEILNVKSDYTEAGVFQKGLQRDVQILKVYTEALTKITTKDGEKEIGASEVFNLRKDADGQLGWSQSPKGKLNKFLKKMKVAAPKELLGKAVTVRIREKENADGTKSEFLGFYIE